MNWLMYIGGGIIWFGISISFFSECVDNRKARPINLKYGKNKKQ